MGNNENDKSTGLGEIILSTIKSITQDVNVIKKVEDVIKTLFGPIAGETGQLWADTVRYRRAQRQAKFIMELQNLTDKKGLKIKAVPDKTLFPLIEKVSLEDNEDLRKKWAALLTSAIIDDFNDKNYNTFINILGELDSLDTKILDFIYKLTNDAQNDDAKIIEADIILREFKVSQDEVEIEVNKLARLSIIRFAPDRLGDLAMTSDIVNYNNFQLTALGKRFIEKCQE